MAKPETNLVWHPLRDNMDWQAQRLEDRFTPGVPDVVFQMREGGAGWLELKYSVKRVRAGTVQTLPHFTPQQRMFLNKWDHAWLLWRVADQWFLYQRPFDMLGHISPEVMEKQARYVWDGYPNWNVLGTLLNVSPCIGNVSGGVIQYADLIKLKESMT